MRHALARSLIGIVLCVNVQCGIIFLLRPEIYASGFELQGAAGEAMVRGMGLLFLMWNVPYGVAFWDPIRHRIALYEALAMQAIGLSGETYIYLSLPSTLVQARASLSRFILFDALGLVALVAAAWLVRIKIQKHP